MPAEPFVAALNEQIGREFGAGQAYLAAAIWYDDATFPQLSKLFYAQAAEEREHALMMCQYLLESDIRPTVPGVNAPKTDFGDFVEPIRAALEQEKRVTDQISELLGVARSADDFQSEQFVHWFLKEQVEEVDLFSSLLDVAERCRERPMDLEDYIAREGVGAPADEDPTAPPTAGG